MVRRLRYLPLLSGSLVPAQHLFHRNDMYGSHPALPPDVTVTVTATHLASPTGDGNACGVVYVPITVTVYTSCTSNASSVSGLPMSTHNTRSPWTNSTTGPSPPCTQSWPTGITPPRNFSTSLGWNHTTPVSYPTVIGTVGTAIESAEPIGTSSVLWGNSTRVTATQQHPTIHLTRTVTSSTIVTSTTAGTPVSRPSLGTGANSTVAHTALASYQSTMTYQTTLLIPSSSVPLLSPNNMTTTVRTIASNDPIFISTSTASSSDGGSGDGYGYGSYTFLPVFPSSATEVSDAVSGDPVQVSSKATTSIGPSTFATETKTLRRTSVTDGGYGED